MIFSQSFKMFSNQSKAVKQFVNYIRSMANISNNWEQLSVFSCHFTYIISMPLYFAPKSAHIAFVLKYCQKYFIPFIWNITKIPKKHLFWYIAKLPILKYYQDTHSASIQNITKMKYLFWNIAEMFVSKCLQYL